MRRCDSDGGVPSHDAAALREDLRAEYGALLDAVTAFDQRFLTIKGWSVTLSLAALGLGFQYGHYAFFGLGAVSGLAFWLIDGAMKTHQLRYYARMRDIEVAAYHLNRVSLPELGEFFSPRIDESWGYRARRREPDRRTAPPQRRTPAEIRRMLGLAWWLPHVLLPHAVAVLVGAGLFLAAVADVGPLAALAP